MPFEARVVSAHRTPDWLFEYAETAAERGLQVIIAGAGGAAHLPGMLAAKTLMPVLGVPVPATSLNGLDALLSIVQMPKGVPVGTLAIGAPGAANAAILAAEILALHDPALGERLRAGAPPGATRCARKSCHRPAASESLAYDGARGRARVSHARSCPAPRSVSSAEDSSDE